MNKKTIVFLIGLSIARIAPGAVTFRLADPNTLLPLSIQEIVLGSPVSLVIHSDANEPWKGGLFIEGPDRALSAITGRGNQPILRHYPASCLTDAGANARAMHWKDSVLRGFDFYTDFFPSPGDWFVVDYVPLKPGVCRIAFYDYTQNEPNGWHQPLSTLLLENTPSRDFGGDGLVNLADFAQFASVWMNGQCGDPFWCDQGDLDRDGLVGLTDLLMFSDYWLWGMPGWKPSPEPAGPNLFYRIADGEEADEIVLPVGESITLYIYKTTAEEAVHSLYLEAAISDTSLGWIDNTEYDPNNPPGVGTARILVSPRTAFFDYWAEGITQPEGIHFYAVNVGSPLNDGPAASFVYTAAEAGDVTLTLIDYGTVPSSLGSILIHQTDPMMGMMSQPMNLLTTSLSAETESMQTESVQIVPAFTVEETVEFLETVWEEEPEVRQAISEDDWNEFIEEVKESAAAED